MTAKQGGALEIVQRRSGIGYDSKQKATLKALGLGKVGRTRTHPDGTPLGGWQPQEKLDGETALRLYTEGGAYAAFQENELGRIAPGFRADLTVLDGDPVACEPADLLTMQVLMTVVDGRVVHPRP